MSAKFAKGYVTLVNAERQTRGGTGFRKALQLRSTLASDAWRAPRPGPHQAHRASASAVLRSGPCAAEAVHRDPRPLRSRLTSVDALRDPRRGRGAPF